MNIKLLKSEQQAIIGSLIGNVVEFYDFMIFIFLLKYLSTAFFPATNETLGLLKALSVSMGAYLVRPLGALYFGKIGDQSGRKKALLYSILAASLATACIGLLPSFATAGMLAPALLLALRLLQGFAVSGEQGGAAVFLRELLGRENSCFAGALVVASVFVGFLFGAFTCFVISSSLSTEQMYSWGWRLPFLLAAPLGIISYLYRTNTKESPVFLQLLQSNNIATQPIKELFNQHRTKIIALILLGSIYAAVTSMYLVFVPNYIALQQTRAYSANMLFLSQGLLIMVILIPLFAIFVDRIGVSRALRISAAVIAVIAAPSLLCILAADLTTAWLGQLGFIVMISCITAPVFATIVESFPARIRYVGVSFVLNCSITIFSAATPALGFFLVHTLEREVIAAFCIIVPAIMCFCLVKSKALSASD